MLEQDPQNMWNSLFCAALFSSVLSPMNSSHLGLPRPSQVAFTAQRALLAQCPGSSVRAMVWGQGLDSPEFVSLHSGVTVFCSLMLIVLKTIVLYILSTFCCFRWESNSGSFFLSWPEAGVWEVDFGHSGYTDGIQGRRYRLETKIGEFPLSK